MKTSLTSFLILLCAVFFLSAPAKAQDSCTLKLKVVNLDSGAAISGANVLVIELGTKEFYRRVSEDGVAIFAGLRNSVSYELSVVKSGYKQTIDRMTITCLPKNQMTAEIEIGLQKGKLKETYTPVRPGAAPVGVVPDPGTASPDETPKIVSRGVVNGLALRFSPAGLSALGQSGRYRRSGTGQGRDRRKRKSYLGGGHRRAPSSQAPGSGGGPEIGI